MKLMAPPVRRHHITRQGRGASDLDQTFDRERAQGVAVRIRARRRGVTLGGSAIKDLINEGRS